MLIDLIWVTGEVLCIVALLYGAWLAATATELFQHLSAQFKKTAGSRVTGGRAGYQRNLPVASNRA